MAEAINEQTPPQQPAEEVFSEFNFHNGNLGKVKRIVARHKLKDRIKFLETVIKLHQPLIKAMQVTTKAFQDGVQEGIRQVAEAEKEREVQKEKEATLAGVQEPATQEAAKKYLDLPDASSDLKTVLNPVFAKP